MTLDAFANKHMKAIPVEAKKYERNMTPYVLPEFRSLLPYCNILLTLSSQEKIHPRHPQHEAATAKRLHCHAGRLQFLWSHNAHRKCTGNYIGRSLAAYHSGKRKINRLARNFPRPRSDALLHLSTAQTSWHGKWCFTREMRRSRPLQFPTRTFHGFFARTTVCYNLVPQRVMLSMTLNIS